MKQNQILEIKSQIYQQNTGSTKDFITFLLTSKVKRVLSFVSDLNFSALEYELERPNLKYVKIQFNTPIFDKVTKDRAAKFVDQLSAIGGTMGLLTGFSIISGVEILYFAIKISISYFKGLRKRQFKN